MAATMVRAKKKKSELASLQDIAATKVSAKKKNEKSKLANLQYLSEHFVNVLYFYNIEDRISRKIVKLDSEKVLYENIVVGPARLRQVRVRNDSCTVPEMFRTWFNECYNYYYDMYEDTGSFGPGYAPEWAWQSTVDVTSYTGKVSTYSPDGYFFDMTKRFYVENLTMRELQTSRWIDRATRALLLEFVAYTPNTNLFAVIKLVMELPPGGGVIPTASCYSMQLISFVGLLDIFNLIFAVLTLLFAIYFFIVLLKDLKYFGWPYLFTFWGMLDLTIIILLILLIITAVIREIAVHIKLPGLVQNIDDDKYGSFDMLALTQKLFYGILGVILILCWIKVIKFFAMCTTIAVLFIAVGKSKLRLVALTLMGFLLLIGFSLGAHLFFGVYIEEFSSVGNSIFTLLSIPVGGLYFYEELNYYRPIVAPIFLSLFIFVFILLLLSLFVAVLVYGFERAEEKRILTAPKRKYGFYEYILRLGVVMFNKCKCRKVSRKLEQKEQSIELKKEHELIVSILARHGLRGEEMKLFLLKHGISEHSEATEDQLAKMYKDLKTKQLLEKEVATHNKLQDEIESLQKKLDEMQQQAIHLSAKPTIE